jgi:hypothetical protein
MLKSSVPMGWSKIIRKTQLGYIARTGESDWGRCPRGQPRVSGATMCQPQPYGMSSLEYQIQLESVASATVYWACSTVTLSPTWFCGRRTSQCPTTKAPYRSRDSTASRSFNSVSKFSRTSLFTHVHQTTRLSPSTTR